VFPSVRSPHGSSNFFFFHGFFATMMRRGPRGHCPFFSNCRLEHAVTERRAPFTCSARIFFFFPFLSPLFHPGRGSARRLLSSSPPHFCGCQGELHLLHISLFSASSSFFFFLFFFLPLPGRVSRLGTLHLLPGFPLVTLDVVTTDQIFPLRKSTGHS